MERDTQSEFQSVVDLLHAHAAQHGEDVAMRQKEFGIWQEKSWGDVLRVSQALAAALAGMGIAQGSHVGILSENRQEWVLAQFGIACAGAVTVGMYPTSPSAEIDHLVNASDTEVLFIEDQEQFDKMAELQGCLPKLRKLIVIDPKGTRGETLLGLESYVDVLARGEALLLEQNLLDMLAARRAAITPEQTAMMVFTSGSTGLPKAAEISFLNLHFAAVTSREIFPDYGPDTDILSYLPLCHIAEQNITVINALAGRMVINFGESLRTIALDLRDVAPKIFFGVPRIWEKMQAQISVQAQTAGPLRRPLTLAALAFAQQIGAKPRPDWSAAERGKFYLFDLLVYRGIKSYLGLGRISCAITAAAPVSPNLLAFFRGMGVNLRESWGMSETSGAATMQPDWGASAGRVGVPLGDAELRIAEDGELLMRGAGVFKGYYKNDAATAETISDGWLHTGDVAEVMPDGSISIIDRKKDIMINAAGKNLSPSIIENAMKASPYIKECIVTADQRPYVTALVQIDMDTVRIWAEAKGVSYTTFRSLAESPDVQALIEHEVAQQNGQLARVEQIKKVHLLRKELDHDDGEVTATMKVRRASVAKAYAPEIEALYA